ncbi:MAG: metal-dependent transcriptional regulator [Spirochaetia bacterium]|nr:metal-dependent transcriptional regulator [Spirochaetia bacterium]
MKTFSFHNRDSDETADHILEFLYDKIEKKKQGSLDSLKKLFKNVSEIELTEILETMSSEGLISIKNEEVLLIDNGTKRAELLVRGHRLAQRLMVDVLGISPENANNVAHYMEHVLDAETLDAISAFMGYPEFSPDGKPIPHTSGKKIFTIRPILCKLSDMEIGAYGTIRYIQNPVDSLSQFGILPGEMIRLVQKRPSFILEMGSTTIAIDSAFAMDIYVHQKSK